MSKHSKKPEPTDKREGTTVDLAHWVLVRMPIEEGKSADRYAVVKVSAKAFVEDGTVVESGLQLVYARKRASLEITREADERRRSIGVVA